MISRLASQIAEIPLSSVTFSTLLLDMLMDLFRFGQAMLTELAYNLSPPSMYAIPIPRIHGVCIISEESQASFGIIHAATLPQARKMDTFACFVCRTAASCHRLSTIPERNAGLIRSQLLGKIC